MSRATPESTERPIMEYQSEERGFWGPGTIAAGIILLLVIVAGGALVVLRTTSGKSPSSQRSVSQSPGSGGGGRPSSASSVGSRGNGCSLPSGNQTVPQATPTGVTWQLYQTVAVPYSTTYGPQHINGDVARCYAHDPTGALIAASQIGARYLLAPNWRAVVNQQLVANAGRTKFIENRQAVGNPGGNQPGDYNQLSGFKFVTYSPSTAVIELVTQSSAGVMQATTATVVWVAGDWKLELQPDGGGSPSAFPVASLVGFTPWAGV